MFPTTRRLLGLAASLLAAGCASHPPLPTVESVDLDRFMGDWYVVGHIPAASESEAYNAVESYRRGDDGEILTTYTYRDGGFDGPIEVMQPVGSVRDEETNATWGMEFLWPFSFEYLITWLDADYTATIIGRTARDYAWIMTRDPNPSESHYAKLVAELERQGYDTSRLRRVPQRWPDPEHVAARRAAR